MKKFNLTLAFSLCAALLSAQTVSYEQASRRAGELLKKLTLDEKVDMVHGFKSFFLKGYPSKGIPYVYMSDATQGLHLRPTLDSTYIKQLDRSTAFPAPILLASTWNPRLAYKYAEAIGEECRAAGVGILLGPGMNIYRISQCGRNFEYMGEDPFLAGRIVAEYVKGLQSTGVMACLKHFVANNTEYYRCNSNSLLSERALREIYTPAFQAGIDAGALSVMTSYNLVNGEWTTDDKKLITDLLRNEMGFKWLVMSDWGSIVDSYKFSQSGLDLDMPGYRAPKSVLKSMISNGELTEPHLDTMVMNIMTACIAAGIYDRAQQYETKYLGNFAKHEQVSLETAREGVVMLKNNGVLPVRKSRKVLLTGDNATDTIPNGGGAAAVEGYNQIFLDQALRSQFGKHLSYVAEPTDAQIKAADAVVLSIGTFDEEGRDRAYALPAEKEALVKRITSLNKNTIVVVNSGSGIRMTDWNDQAGAILYSWYPGQNGFMAVAEIISGVTNPSGKLPITLEKDFADSPGAAYLPDTAKLYSYPIYGRRLGRRAIDVPYTEDILVGYRWYDTKNIAPLYHFGYGLSFSKFEIVSAEIDGKNRYTKDDVIRIKYTLTNSGRKSGSEVVQAYISKPDSRIVRAAKELKGFDKKFLKAGEKADGYIEIPVKSIAYYDEAAKQWEIESGEYTVNIGNASNNITHKLTIFVH